jgi:hypothetical protein
MDNPTNSQSMVCTCCTHWGGGRHRFFLLRILLALVVLSIVFCMGVRVGEFKERYGFDVDSYGSRRMMQYGPMSNYNYPVPATVWPQ